MWSLTWPASALLALRWQKVNYLIGSKVSSCDKKWFWSHVVLPRIQCGPRCQPLSSSASAQASRSAWSPATTSTRPGPSRPSRMQNFSQNGLRDMTLPLLGVELFLRVMVTWWWKARSSTNEFETLTLARSELFVRLIYKQQILWLSLIMFVFQGATRSSWQDLAEAQSARQVAADRQIHTGW